MMSFRKIFGKKKLRKRRFLKFFAVFTAFTMLFEGIFPLRVFALTGGPSQPEVQSFEPVGTSDMVDTFSGDFTYNIPLMDVDGYPINISYHSGITMDQEASWVGLGWNINPGVINRGMRGIPDDFDGDTIEHQYNMKPNVTFGLSGDASLELFGSEQLNIGAHFGIGIRYNNYTGPALEKTIGASMSFKSGEGGKGPFTGGLGIDVVSSSDNGLSISPSANFGLRISKVNYGLSANTSFNSRTGVQTLTIKNSVNADVNDPFRYPISVGSSSSFNFGQPTYTPQVSMPMHTFNATCSFKAGGAFYSLHPNFTVSGYYSKQKLAENTIYNQAYGYLNSDEGEGNAAAILDFNREKDGPFTQNMIGLPLTNFTYDVYSLSGQGVGGSYRPFRSDIGHVFDPTSTTTSESYSLGGELGVGGLAHLGLDVAVNYENTTSGKWSYENKAAQNLKFRATGADGLYEKYYFKEANEKSVDSDPGFLAKAGGYDPVMVNLDNSAGKFNVVADDKYSNGTPISTTSYRIKRDKRNQTISVITRKELNDGFGIQYADENLLNTATIGSPFYNSEAKEHHIAEITALNTSGARYVYGIAAYNTKQEETTFAVKETNDATCTTGLVSYAASTENSLNNKSGKDNYFNNTITPAYAHSYLLTAVLSPDYVDADGVKGPSDGDLGSYTKLHYYKVPSPYKWRVPVEKDKATYSEGLKSVNYDDKGNYTYGEKELWYLDTIQTKNYIAIFTLEDRKDGYGVNDENGELSTSAPMKLLRKISLYSKIDYYQNPANAIPIKEVHFEYDYSLCPNASNNYNFVHAIGTATDRGKLTLKKIYFTYGNSNKARLSPYVFTYSNVNPEYNLKNYDRWGNYKYQDPTASYIAKGGPAPNSEFPYVEQDSASANESSRAWALTKINLPSGGSINVNYESDDYAYVQNKGAMEMFKICDINTAADAGCTSVDITGPSPRLYFKLSKDQNGDPITDMDKYFTGIDKLYFRFLMKMRRDTPTDKYEYVSGYADIESKGYSGDYGYVQLTNVHLKDNDQGTSVCPIVKAAIQFGRLNLSKEVWNADVGNDDDPTLGKQIFETLINSGFAKNIFESLQGPNQALYEAGIGTEAIMNKSWIRLNNVTGHKYGGGSRVKQITISDEWSSMTASEESSYNYGQEYSYTNDDGTSSGVAAYEPQIGGDENPWKTPVFYTDEALLAPDNEHYMEEPFGESFFPSPSVGYSKVTVKNLKRTGVTRNATGSVVHEFYTAKDFPTITKRTDKITAPAVTGTEFSISSLLNTEVRDFMTASQGYVIELNDMHGKPKSQKVYQEGQTTPISSVEYKYKSKPYLNGSFRLDNTATVINSLGDVDTAATIGVFFDAVSDMREENTFMSSTSLNGNLESFIWPFPPVLLAIPVLLPSFSSEETQFRSVVVTKVIQRFGILEETIAKDLGSEVSTKNLAYDAETGDVLLTQTKTDFNDEIYSFTYPAYWHYDGMGAAYKNIGYKTSVSFSGGDAIIPSAETYFTEGDELELSDGNIGWVTSVVSNKIHASYKNGSPVDVSGVIKILRSGRRNQQSTSMAAITTLTNPLSGVKSNLFDKVLQAGASEFTNGWKTFCDCFHTTPQGKDGSVSLQPIYTTNPFILGTKGMWKLKRSYLYLSDRTQSNYNNNTYVRNDGLFTSFSPYYKYYAGKWDIDGRNWTYTSEVTEFSPFGVELENKDALGRYSTALYGYNQSLAIGVAANARYRDVGVDNFEDYGFSGCADNHFKFNKDQELTIDNTISHTGSNSLKVNNTSAVTMTKQLTICDSSACSLDISQSYNTQSDEYTLTVFRGTAPYIFDWDITGDDVNISLGSGGNTIVFTKPVNAVSMEITVTDINGCGAIKHIVCDGSNCGLQ